jgi:hypothetical protein
MSAKRPTPAGRFAQIPAIHRRVGEQVKSTKGDVQRLSAAAQSEPMLRAGVVVIGQ